MNFKAQLDRDIKTVFHNSGEHADITEFRYNGNRYKVPIVLDYAGAKDRNKPSTDNVDGILIADLVMYIAFLDLKVVPKKGKTIEIGDDAYTIAKVENEAGEIMLHLEMMDE